jgi:hypothetical protein
VHHRTLNAFKGTINLTTYNEVLYDLYSSITITKVIKSRRMGWMGHVECYGREVHKRFWRGNLKEKKPLG